MDGKEIKLKKDSVHFDNLGYKTAIKNPKGHKKQMYIGDYEKQK